MVLSNGVYARLEKLFLDLCVHCMLRELGKVQGVKASGDDIS